MADLTGESKTEALRLDFDRRLLLQFRGSTITSDAGLLAYRELDDTLQLTDTAADKLADARTGKNGRHRLAGLLRQSVFGRLAGYDDVNDAERLCRDPAMRWVVGDRAISGSAASASQMGRFETKWLCRPENLAALADLPGQWIDKVRRRRGPKTIVLDIDSSESPTYGEQEGSAYNGHFACTCYHPLFVFNQFGDVERCALRPGNVHSADDWRAVLEPVIARYRGIVNETTSRQSAAAGPGTPVRSNWNGDFSCTAHSDGKLPAISWKRIPFRQEGNRITGLYDFTDHFKHQNSVMFSGTLTGQSARVEVTAVRTDGSPNFTAEMTGSRASMTGSMMSGMSRQPVRSCTLVLSAA